MKQIDMYAAANLVNSPAESMKISQPLSREAEYAYQYEWRRR